jgi:predicted phosphodiesterase
VDIAILTDSHFGFNAGLKAPNMDLLEQLKLENPQMILHCGDTCLTNYLEAWEYWKLVRSYFPDITIGTVLGNHDMWDKLYNTLEIPMDILETYKKSHSPLEVIEHHKKILKEFDIKYLPEDPIHKKGISIIGVDGWYSDPDVPFHETNDHARIPHYHLPEGHQWLCSRSHEQFGKAIGYLGAARPEAKTTVLVTHFGFTREATEKDWKNFGGAAYFGNSPIYEEMIDSVDFLFFGHSHVAYQGKAHNGHTNVINIGGTYGDPMSSIITI